MSRYVQKIGEDTTIEYGFDRVPVGGYFLSIERMEDTPEGRLAKVVKAGDTRSVMVAHENERHMERGEILDVLKECDVREDHLEAIAMDRPF